MPKVLTPVRVLLLASYIRGRTLLHYLTQEEGRKHVTVVGCCTDDPDEKFSNARFRFWRYPGFNREDKSMVKRLAEERGIPVYDGSLKNERFSELWEQWKPELCVMAAFGQKIAAEWIARVDGNWYNTHPTSPDAAWPAYGGPKPYEEMYEAGVESVAMALHRIDPEWDGGELVGYSESQPMPFLKAKRAKPRKKSPVKGGGRISAAMGKLVRMMHALMAVPSAQLVVRSLPALTKRLRCAEA